MKVVIVGGVAGGATAAARIRRLDEKAEIVVFERSGYISYANCGLPYYIGDTITRDTYHLSYSHGRYLAALTWFAALTGGNVDDVTWLPSDYPELADDLPVIRQSVKDAIKTPFAITQQQK